MENNKAIIIRDERGTHEDGVGWNPAGGFCGECGSTDCTNCRVWTRQKANRSACEK